MEELVPLLQNGWIQEERLQTFLGLVLSLFPAKGNHSSPRTLTGQDWQGRIRMTARFNAVPCGRRGSGVELLCEFPGQLSRTMSEESGECYHPITRSAFVIPHNIFKAQLFLSQASDRQNSTPSSFQLPASLLARIFHPWITCHCLPPPNTTSNPASGLTMDLRKMHRPYMCSSV